MHQRSASKKTTQSPPSSNHLEVSAGSSGIALAPPAYGIDVLDRTSGSDEPEFAQGQPAAPQTGTAQLRAAASTAGDEAEARPENRTGLPGTLKAGIETLSGLALDDVRVHYNSPRPAQLQALAYTQGSQIYLGPGQQRHLPHEAWHVVQQKQGRVQPTLSVAGTPVNDNPALENEADVLSAKASKVFAATAQTNPNSLGTVQKKSAASTQVAQRLIINLDPEDATIASSVEAIKANIMPNSDVTTLGTARLWLLRPMEPLVISGHGERLSTAKEPNIAWDKEYDDESEKSFREMGWSHRPATVDLPILTPQGLFDALVEKGWSRRHKGDIDLRSCWSAMPSHKPNFILQFVRLIHADGRKNSVIGYKGPTETLQATGEEKVRALFWYQLEEAQKVTNGIRTLVTDYFRTIDLQSAEVDKEAWKQKRSEKDNQDVEELVKIGIKREQALQAVLEKQEQDWEEEMNLRQQRPEINFNVSVLIQNRPYNILTVIDDRMADLEQMRASNIPLWVDETRVFDAFEQAYEYVNLDEPVRLDRSAGKDTYNYLANWRLLELPTTYRINHQNEFEMPWKTTINPKNLSRGGYHEV